MEDARIVDLYWARSESAISETSAKYGKYCHAIAYNILANHEDADESVNDTYLDAWNTIPPHRPSILSTFLGNPGQVFSREQLYEQVWDEHSAYNVDGVVKSQIRLLRQKLSATGREYIKNVWGVGYRFHNEPEGDNRYTVFLFLLRPQRFFFFKKRFTHP